VILSLARYPLVCHPRTRLQDEDSSKRKTELETAHKAEARTPEASPEEQAEWKRVFKDF
jgi:hypothetical protein